MGIPSEGLSGLVGAPKNLADLYRIEAQVRVTCTSCRATEVWDLGALIAEVRRAGGNTDWRGSRAWIKCPKRCPAPIISLVPIPYGKQRARRRAHRHMLVNLSLRILRDAAARSAVQAVGTIEVRLALHVLRPFVRDQELLNEFWSAAIVMPRHPWASCYLPYRRLVERLTEQGADVEPQNRP